MNELLAIAVQPEFQQSKTEDKSGGLAIRNNQPIRTVTIGINRGPGIEVKHATVMLRKHLQVC
jgi:hypothetical protein